MLTTDDQQKVTEALFLAFSANAHYRDLIPVIFGPVAGDVLPRLPTVPGTDVDAARVVTICLGSRWTRTPALLSMVLDYLVTNQGHGELAGIRDRVATGEDPNASLFGSLWLTTERPFFDRGALRDPLRSLVERNVSPILLIQAPADGFGRSYTRELIEDVARQSNNVTKAAPVAISRGTGPTYDVRDLALDILAHAGVMDAPDREDSSSARGVARYVLGRLLGDGAQWIIVLDGFKQDVKADVREAIGMLATLIPVGQFRASTRLVLIDYPRTLLPDTVSAADILEEQLLPASDIAAEHIRPALVDIAARRAAAGKPPIPEADLPKVLQQILDKAPAAGKERLESLNAQLSAIWTFHA